MPLWLWLVLEAEAVPTRWLAGATTHEMLDDQERSDHPAKHSAEMQPMYANLVSVCGRQSVSPRITRIPRLMILPGDVVFVSRIRAVASVGSVCRHVHIEHLTPIPLLVRT